MYCRRETARCWCIIVEMFYPYGVLPDIAIARKKAQQRKRAALVVIKSLQKFTRFIWWIYSTKRLPIHRRGLRVGLQAAVVSIHHCQTDKRTDRQMDSISPPVFCLNNTFLGIPVRFMFVKQQEDSALCTCTFVFKLVRLRVHKKRIRTPLQRTTASLPLFIVLSLVCRLDTMAVSLLLRMRRRTCRGVSA